MSSVAAFRVRRLIGLDTGTTMETSSASWLVWALQLVAKLGLLRR